MNIIQYYQNARDDGLKPLLLEFNGLAVCGVRPRAVLEVREGFLYRNERKIGVALDIFAALKLKPAQGFFPAWMGYFSYEFASVWGKIVHAGERCFPDAQFWLFEQGLVLESRHQALAAPSIDKQILTPALSKNEFFKIITEIKDRIGCGDVYQVNFTMPSYFSEPNIDSLSLYLAMRRANPSHFMGLIESDDLAIISGSPERLFSLNQGELSTRPIAGTSPRGAHNLHYLRTSPKENAEHAMLVDLMRNDMNIVAERGSLRIREDRTVEFYSHVMHLVSDLSAKTKQPLSQVMRALFPGGTITGAPKESVMSCIAELEAGPRGPYTGSMAYISAGYGVDFNIVIRSVLKAAGRTWINTGAGIVIDSEPEREWQEIGRKAGVINDILSHRLIIKTPRDKLIGKHSEVVMRPNPRLSGGNNSVRLCFIENRDSFSYNIIDALVCLGAELSSFEEASHVVIGPGPGNPEQMPDLAKIIRQALEKNLPLLGICLGHQAIGHYFGAEIIKLKTPVHGKSCLITHNTQGLFKGLNSPLYFTRYHSLAVKQAPSDFIVDAYSEDDYIMALRHKKLPIFALQFHPESYLSPDGYHLLTRFLESRHG